MKPKRSRFFERYTNEFFSKHEYLPPRDMEVLIAAIVENFVTSAKKDEVSFEECLFFFTQHVIAMHALREQYLANANNPVH